MMRPSVPSPTGTAIGLPVSVTAWPRTRPSVVSIAMVRTVDSPRCWATSSTSRWPWFCVSSAFRIAGSVAVELHVDDGADDLGDVSGGIGHEGLLKAWKGQTAVSVTGTLPRVAFE